mgnify:FL=1
MNTQLILYPQTYNGTYNSVSTASLTEYLVNGISFTGINSTPIFTTSSNTPMQAAISGTPSLVLGNWYRFNTIIGGVFDPASEPVLSAGELDLFNGTPGDGVSGIYQRLSGLAVGGQYDVVVNISTPASGNVHIKIFNGTVQAQSFSVTANLNTITYTFTSPSTSPTFLISYIGKPAGSLGLDSISIKESAHTVSGVFSELSDGQVICDLYEEEDIPLTLSVDDFKNVAEKVQSYSKDFNLPATKRNNQIFNNMFEITRSYDGLIFNPYIKTQCVLKQDGFILFEGYLRMITIIEQNGEISYNVNLYSDVIALADILKDQTFADLDFSELTHSYNYTNIRNSWQGDLLLTNPLSTSSFAYSAALGVNNTGVLKYPFIDWTHQIALDPTSGFPILPNLETAFRPCIKLKYLINRIFEAAGFEWTSDFFDSADFDKLYMDFNWGSNELSPPVTGGSYSPSSPTVLSTTSFTALPLDYIQFDSQLGYDSANNRFVATYNYQTYLMEVPAFAPSFLSAQTLETRWAHYNSANVLINTYNVSSQVVPMFVLLPALTTPLTTMILQAGDYIQFEWKTNTAGQGRLGTSGTHLIITGTIGALVITTNDMLQTLRGETGQWEFLKGIMTMFNLVSMVDEGDPENILIEPYADIFVTNPNTKTLDWTDKIDVSKMELKPLTNLNKKTIFQFVEDPDDYVFMQYKNSTSGHLYGSLNWEAQEGFTILDGEKQIIAKPFAATVSKSLEAQFTDFIVPSLYAMSDDGISEGFDNSPRIFYSNGVQILTSCTYSVPPQNGGLGASFEDEFLQFSHLTDIPTAAGTRDFVFTSDQLYSALVNPVAGVPVKNLFNVYWLPYFNELYNPNTRTMTLQVSLSPSDINSFRFYDKIQIKNRTFRVNKIDYKPNALATVEFILIP